MDHVVEAEEDLKEKTGLAPLMEVAKEVHSKLGTFDLDDVLSIFGHCKLYSMYDKNHIKLVFVFPYLVNCKGQVTTLGSVISRLLRSMGFPRKAGTAPAGFLERQLKLAIEARKAQR